MPKELSAEIAELEETLEKNRAEQLDELREKLKAARAVVKNYEAQIAEITGKEPESKRRKKMSEEERLSLVTGELSKNPNGLSQMEISQNTGIPYPTLV